ncbi:MAG: hypothetical protein ACI4F4_07340 [Lachnospiraceae bacterium]
MNENMHNIVIYDDHDITIELDRVEFYDNTILINLWCESDEKVVAFYTKDLLADGIKVNKNRYGFLVKCDNEIGMATLYITKPATLVAFSIGMFSGEDIASDCDEPLYETKRLQLEFDLKECTYTLQ